MTLDALEDLPRTPATDVKKQGWRGLMKTVGRIGKVVVTNHNMPEAVILSTAEYDAIVVALREAASRDDPALEALRRRFDARLAALDAADAGDRLRGLMRTPVRLNGEVKAGEIRSAGLLRWADRFCLCWPGSTVSARVRLAAICWCKPG